MSAEPVGRPVVAIVGSVDPARRDQLGLRDVERAPAACEALGRALAEQGMNVVVYSSDPQFVEGDIVRGYLSAETEVPPKSISVHLPHTKRDKLFPEVTGKPEVFDVRPDTSDDWEVSYYRSVLSSDGVLMIGGGRSTQVTGLVALSVGIPVLPVSAFGGNAEKVWRTLEGAQHHADPGEVAMMGSAWRDDHAGPLVASLAAQKERRDAVERAEQRRNRRSGWRNATALLSALVLLLVSLATIPFALTAKPNTWLIITLVVVSPTLAAATGALIRNVFDRGREWLRTAVLGTAAGAIAGLLAIAAQLVTTPDVLSSPEAGRLLIFLVPVGFIAGLTFDDVYAKLRAQDVTRTDALNF